MNVSSGIVFSVGEDKGERRKGMHINNNNLGKILADR